MRLTEGGLNPQHGKHFEGALTQGNGYLHLRASYEEGLRAAPQDEDYMRMPANVTVEKPRHARSKKGFYVPGVTGRHPLLREELVNLPDPLLIQPVLAGERLDMDDCEIRDYERVLRLSSGVLSRRFVWRGARGCELACEYERFASMVRKHLIVQRATYRALNADAVLTVFCGIDQRVRTNGYDHFAKMQKSASAREVRVRVTTDNGDEIQMRSYAVSDRGQWQAEEEMQALHVTLRTGETLTVEKYTVISTSRDRDDLPQSAEFVYEALLAEQEEAWETLWEQARITVEGDDRAQEAIDFSVYHLLRCVSETDDRIAVCAKGFAGEAYFGHFFWDSEIYLLPFFLYHFPERGKNLVRFRIRTLEGARKNAALGGYAGARYPWESSVTGEEQCPNWQYADHELHVTADVVLGLWHTYRATHDEAFLREAAPVFLETARFWLDRMVEEEDGSLSVKGVMGPDEYICLCDNNAYTNFMIRFALERTLEVMTLLSIEDAELKSRIGHAAARLRCPADGQGVIPQCDGFERYEEPRFERFWPDRSKPYGASVSQERNYRTKALKQADVLMLPYLFPSRFSQEQTAQNLAYYLPYTTHDSSLSAVVHAIILCRLNRVEEAYEYFARALEIDLNPANGGAAEGIHIANCGGLWQAMIMGFAGFGLAYEQDFPSFSPRLPARWKRLAFKLNFQGRTVDVEIGDDGVAVNGGNAHERQ